MQYSDNTKPGFFLKMFLRNTPIPSLLRHYLSYQGGESFRLVEDNEFPDELTQYLQKEGYLSGHEGFFVKDRTDVRAAIVVENRIESIGDPMQSSSIREMKKAMKIWLEASGKMEDTYKIIACDKLKLPDLQSSEDVPYLLIVWTPERTFLEEFIGGRKKLELHEETIDNNNVPVRVIEGSLDDLTEKPSGLENDIPEIVNPAKFTEDWEQWKSLRYKVAGRLRGKISRKLYVVLGEEKMKLSLLSSPGELSEDYVLSFFDRIRSSSNGVTAHKQIFENSPLPDGTFSISYEISGDGEFRALIYGIYPVIWRAQKRRLISIKPTVRTGYSTETKSRGIDPISKNVKPRIHTLHGKLRTGDVMLILPAPLTGVEKESLIKIFKSDEAGLLGEKLGEWIDADLWGKTLVLTLDESSLRT